MPDSQVPLVSVILPVYNAGEYLRPAVDSILNQTFPDFELIIIDDCSPDDSLAVARTYEADPRVRVLANAQNRGRSFSDNYAATFARGRYIAKMDADDVARPDRLQRQVAFLEQNPAVGLTSSFMQCFGVSDIVYKYPVTADEVRSFMLFNMPVANPTVMFRHRLLTEHGLRYDDTILDTFGEDYEFIARASEWVSIVNQPEILLNYRTLPQTQKADVHAQRNAKSNQIRERLLRRFGIPFSARELLVHNTISYVPFTLGDITLPEVHAWLWKIRAHNDQTGYADPAAMRRCVAERWFLTCYLNPDKATNGFREYRRFPLAQDYPLGPKLLAKFLLKSYVLRHR